MPKMLEQLLDGEGNAIAISGDVVVDQASGQSFAQHAGDTGSHVPEGAINDRIAVVANALSALSTTLEIFLTGSPDGGAIDRLKELVAAIEANKDSVDAIVSGYLKKTDLYDELDSDDATKALTAKQGKALAEALAAQGGIAVMASLTDTPIYSGKIRMLVTDYAPLA